MKKIKKIFFLLIVFGVIISIFQIFQNEVNAFGVEDLNGTPITNQEANNIGNKIITAISTIGAVVSVIVLVVIGIRYMFGSVEEKAEYKKSLMPYTIGALFVFAASTIAGIIYSVLT